MDEQAEFEKWALSCHFCTLKDASGTRYLHDSTNCAYEGWKARGKLEA